MAVRQNDEPADEPNEAPLDEAVLGQARSDREGLEWWLDRLRQEDATEAAQLSGAGSATPISVKAFDLIVEFEVSSKQVYENKYRGTIWPGGASGVTIGIGYDVGYTTVAQLRADWIETISAAMIATLERAVGVQGAPVKALTTALRPSVNIPFGSAITVHRGKVMPRWVALVERALPNTGRLGPDSLGALVSLTYNRGASYANSGERFREMRAIKTHMTNRAFTKIPAQFRSMKRLWPTVPGLQTRRAREARLFEASLAATPSV